MIRLMIIRLVELATTYIQVLTGTSELFLHPHLS